MRKRLIPLAVAALVIVTACGDSTTTPTGPSEDAGPTFDPAPIGSAQARAYVPGRVLARFRPGASIATAARDEGFDVERSLMGGTRVLSVTVGREEAVAEALRANPLVEFAEPDIIYTVDLPCGTGSCRETTDPLFSFRWDLHNDGTVTDGLGVDVATTGQIDADLDWLEAFDAMGPLPGTAVIGIIDTGILGTHVDLAPKIVAGYDFFANDPDPTDDNGHGTHVAGIAAGLGDDGTGVPGIAWVPEVEIAAAKVCGLIQGFLYGCPSSAIADGITWATDNGANVLNLSLGGPQGSAVVQGALQYARQNGVLPICAAGNDAAGVGFPAGFPECEAVSSTNWSDELASYSNFGPEVQLAAPGGDFEDPNEYSYILSSHNSADNGYAWLLGTSMASPQVAGLAGLLHALGVTGDVEKLTRMQNTANDLGAPGIDDLYGAGRINVFAAVADLVGVPSNQAPSASFTVNCTDLACDFTDTSTDGEGSVVAWAWDFGDGNTSTQQNPSHTFATEGTYTVSLTATDDEAASGSTSGDVTVPIPNQPPTASFSSACSGFTCDFTDTSTDLDGSIDGWAWDFGDGNSSTEQNPSHTYAVAGPYTVTLTVTDDDADNDTTTGDVSVAEPNQPPVAGFTVDCTDLTCTFTDTSTDSDGTITTYQWSFGDGWGTNAQSPTYTYGIPGTFTVSHWVIDDDAAADTITTDVTVFEAGEAPTASFTVSCTDLSCDFTDTSTDEQGTVEGWAWDFGDGATSTEQNPSYTFAAEGTYTVSLTATDDVGATGDFSRSVIVPSGNQPPTATFTFDCTGLGCDFTDTSVDADGTIVGWAWDFGDGNSSTEQSPSHGYAVAGPYTVTLTVTDDDGATDTVTGAVAVAEPNQPPVASFTVDCTDLTCSFTDTSTDSDGTLTTYQWAFGDGWGTNAQNPTYTYGIAGTFTVSHWVTDDDAAADTATVDVTVFAPGEAPTASFSVTCSGLSCDFTDASTDDQGSVVGWSWDFGDGNTSTQQNPTHAYAADGTYTVTLTATDDVGATGSFDREVIVPSGNQPPSAAFGSSCTDLSCALTDASVDGDGAIVGWSWDFGDGNTSTEQNPTHAYATEGTYPISLTVTDDGGATASTTGSVSVVEPNLPPSAGFTYSCDGVTCSFTDTSTDSDGSLVAYQWSFGDGWGINAQNPTYTYGAPGTYTVTHWVVDNDQAADTVSQVITVGEIPVASFAWSCADTTCDFTDTSTDGDGSVVFWSWDFGDGGSSFARNPTHTFGGAGDYTVTLTVSDDDNATDETVRVVTVTEPPPNQAPTAAFSETCSDLACDFTDASTDPDGSVVSWSWDFGDGGTASTASPSYAYAAGGTFAVSLTVIDDDGSTDAVVRNVTVSDPPPPITLTADGFVNRRGRSRVNLNWSGATTNRIEVYRDGVRVRRTANDGFYRDRLPDGSTGTFAYQICEDGSTVVCSPVVTVTF